MDPRVREGDKCGGGLTGTRDSDEGHFSRREEGWELGEEKERKSKNKSVDIRASGYKADPPSAVGGLKGIYKRVGSWGKKKKRIKGMGQAPAD